MKKSLWQNGNRWSPLDTGLPKYSNVAIAFHGIESKEYGDDSIHVQEGGRGQEQASEDGSKR